MEDLFYIGTAMKSVRKKRNLTLEETAKFICSERQLIRIEQNQSLPNLWTFILLCDKLKIDYSEVILEAKKLKINR